MNENKTNINCDSTNYLNTSGKYCKINIFDFFNLRNLIKLNINPSISMKIK